MIKNMSENSLITLAKIQSHIDKINSDRLDVVDNLIQEIRNLQNQIGVRKANNLMSRFISPIDRTNRINKILEDFNI